MSPTQDARAAARELADQIGKQKGLGLVPKSSLETMSQQVRREVEEALSAKDKQMGGSVLTYGPSL